MAELADALDFAVASLVEENIEGTHEMILNNPISKKDFHNCTHKNFGA